jgi:hypothetical protein
MSNKTVQRIAAGAAVAVAIVFAVQHWWVFTGSSVPLPAKPSLAQLVLSDWVTLGLVRLGLALLAVFIIASVPALIVQGRWLKGFSASGVTADDPIAAKDNAIDVLTAQIKVLQLERDKATALAQQAVEAL